MAKLSIRDLDLSGKRVLIRVDFNVPQDKATGAITNNQRIVAALPTIQFALEKGASVILMSHLGRPDGQKIEKFSLKPVADELSKLLGKPVTFLADCVGPEVEAACAAISSPATSCCWKTSASTSRKKARPSARTAHPSRPSPPTSRPSAPASPSSATSIVNDAFGTAHRAHSSMVGVDLPQKAAGFLMEAEINAFTPCSTIPKRPLLAILGGAKIADKIPLITNLLDKADKIIIGGGMAYTFRKVNHGMEIGSIAVRCRPVRKSSPNSEAKAKASAASNCIFPVDFVCADSFSPDANTQPATLKAASPPAGRASTPARSPIELYHRGDPASKTIIWNGPAGRVRVRRTSPKPPRPWPMPSPPPPKPARSPSSAVETPPPPPRNSASIPRSPIAPPAAEPASSSSKARSCPAWPRSPKSDIPNITQPPPVPNP